MGQKVNPVGFRLGFNVGWSSHWFANSKDYAKLLQEDDAIRSIITKRYSRASIASIELYRNRGDIVVTIHTGKPGVIIGRGGAGSQELRRLIDEKLNKLYAGLKKPGLRLNIVEVKNPELSAAIVAESIAGQIERRISVKRAIRQSVERTMEKKAKGIKIKVTGRLNGAEIAREENVANGSIPLQTLRSNISYSLAQAHTTYGVIGIKVWIYLGESDTFPIGQITEGRSRS
jgi:small subunit ribosomal protein S3